MILVADLFRTEEKNTLHRSKPDNAMSDSILMLIKAPYKEHEQGKKTIPSKQRSHKYKI
jgi:hypothetical protein